MQNYGLVIVVFSMNFFLISVPSGATHDDGAALSSY